MRSPAEAAGTAADRPEPRDRAVLAVVGDLVEDIVVWTSEPVRHGTDTASRVFRTRGGSGANVAALAASTAGAAARFIGCVGPDAAGDALVGALEAIGVDVRVQRRGTTGAVVLLVDPDGERSMFPDRGAAAELGPVDGEWLDGVAWLHAPLYGFEREPMRASLLALLGEARRRGIRCSIDASSTGLVSNLGVAAVLDLLAGLRPDVLFANETEAALLGLGPGDATAGVATTTVVKHGASPTEVFAAGSLLLREPVPRVAEVRDLTGAGDAFAAGYLAALLDGAEVGDAVRSGHASAAEVIGSPGSGGVDGGAAAGPGAAGPGAAAPSASDAPDVNRS